MRAQFAPESRGRSRRTQTLTLLVVPFIITPSLAGAMSPDVAPTTEAAPVHSEPAKPTNAPPSQGPLELEKPATVTLITGDKVTVHPGGLVETKPGPGREHIVFDEQSFGDVIRVVPSDAARLLREGKLDERLFNVTYLIREGYDDAYRARTPLIVQGTPESVREVTAGPGAKTTGLSSALRMSTVEQSKSDDDGRLWSRLTGEKAAPASLPQGVQKIWLDGRVHVTLDESVPQIGAPEVWDSGYTGEGVKVAVLDTGVDSTHPDLAGQVIANEVFAANPSSLGVFTAEQVDFPIQYLAVTRALPVPKQGTSDPLVDVGPACVDSEGDELQADPAGKTALIVRGPCPFSEKYDAVVEAGATGVVFYNNEAGLFSGTVTGAEHEEEVWAATIADTGGGALRDLLADEEVALTFADRYPGDLFGHGTHVASTIAGTGEASDGARKGVAPDAEILNGKVLGDTGGGQESWIIAGMEWAARSDADVINMSLGGAVTDGSDPMSQAVNTLTESHDVLFVVAAGNSGTRGPSFVGTPGTADAALTVGAVDKDDRLAAFSSRGPRIGDGVVKPEITAPGVGVVAARAAGTALGSPIDDRYTSLNGTSMATPHVAGAAALLAQAGQDLDAMGLKDALASTSVVGKHLWFEQGAGRVDVARAVTQGAYADASVNFGNVDHRRGLVKRQITYTNFTRRAVSLKLEASLTDLLGRPAGELRLSSRRLVLRAGRQVTVEATLDPEALVRGGPLGGMVTATGRDVSLQTAVGLTAARTTTPLGDDWDEEWTTTYRPVDDSETNLKGAALTPDGNQMILFGIKASTDDPQVLVMATRAATGEQIWLNQLSVTGLSRDPSSGGVVVSPDGGRVYVSQDLWDPERSERDIVTIAYNNTPPRQLGDPELGERLWQASHATRFSQGAGSVGGERIAITPNGETILVVGSDTVEGRSWVDDTDMITIAYDAATGEQRWLSRHESPGRLDRGHDIAISPTGDLGYVTAFEQPDPDDPRVRPVTIAYELTGAAQGDSRWVARHDSTTTNYQSWHNSVSEDGERVFASSTVFNESASVFDGRMLTHAYDSATGKLLWTSEFGAADYGFAPGHTGTDRKWKGAIAVSPHNDLVFVTGHHCEGSTCTGAYALVTIAYDQTTGDEVWHRVHESQGVPGRITRVLPRGTSVATSPDGDSLYVVGACCWSSGDVETSDQATIAYDAETGDILAVAHHKFDARGRSDGYQALVSPDGDSIYAVGEVSPEWPRPSYWGVATYLAPISLSAEAYKSSGHWSVGLAWSGPRASEAEIYRDGELVATVENDGSHVDDLGRLGRGRMHEYKVCVLDAARCSKEVTIEVGPGRPARTSIGQAE